MNPEKRRAASKRGMAILHARIIPLRAELYKLEKAYLRLLKNKWKAEEELVGVKVIPLGMTAHKAEMEEKALKKKMEDMSAEEATELLALLEKRLEGRTNE